MVFSWVSAAEGAKWGGLVNDVTDKIRALGPYDEQKRLVGSGVE